MPRICEFFGGVIYMLGGATDATWKTVSRVVHVLRV